MTTTGALLGSGKIDLVDYLPKSLDNIIRANRNHCRLALATEGEMEQLSHPLNNSAVSRHLIRWQILALHLSGNGKAVQTFHLVGRVRGTREAWMTSKVQAIDLKRRRVRTENSLYGLWGPQGRESDIDLLYVCATLNYGGIGPLFGVPELFF